MEIKYFEYLPLFCHFPREVLENNPQCVRFLDMPRSIHGLPAEPEWCRLIDNELFLEMACDFTSCLVWPAFGIRTYMECFSGHDPLWQLAHAAPLWREALELLGGPSPQKLAFHKNYEMPWLSFEEAQELFYQVGLRGIEHHHLTPVIETIRKMRCFEDYDTRSSHAKTDFIRKWYHTRAKAKTVSLDSIIENRDRPSRSDAVDASLGDFVEDRHARVEPEACFRADVMRLYDSLSEKDRKILSMRSYGYTWQEIAKHLGYKNHSAPLKRMQHIKEKYLKLEQQP